MTFWRFRSALTFRSRAVHYNLYLLENSLGWTVIRRTISRLFLFIQFSNVLTAVRRYMPIIYFCFFRPSAIRSANSPVKDNSIIAAPHSSRISPPSSPVLPMLPVLPAPPAGLGVLPGPGVEQGGWVGVGWVGLALALSACLAALAGKRSLQPAS